MPFGRDTLMVPSNIVLDRTGTPVSPWEGWDLGVRAPSSLRCRLSPSYFGPCCYSSLRILRRWCGFSSWCDVIMVSTAPQTQHHSSVRRPALFLSPTSSNIGHARQSSSPSLPSRFHTADPKPSVPEVRLAVLGALGVGKSGMKFHRVSLYIVYGLSRDWLLLSSWCA